MNYIQDIGRDPILHFNPKLNPHASSHGHDGDSPQLCDFVKRFFSLPGFRRTWTAQEFVLAREVTLVCGPHYLDGRVLWHSLQNIVSHFSGCCKSSARLIV